MINKSVYISDLILDWQAQYFVGFGRAKLPHINRTNLQMVVEMARHSLRRHQHKATAHTKLLEYYDG